MGRNEGLTTKPVPFKTGINGASKAAVAHMKPAHSAFSVLAITSS